MLPTAGPAMQSIWCPPFPLPTSVRVGQSWTYSIEKFWHGRDNDRIAYRDSQYVGTQTTTVVGSHQVGERTYLELDDGRLYRVDEAGRTWRYDVGTGAEKILWDIWGPPIDDALLAREPQFRYVAYPHEEGTVKEIVVGGEVLGYSRIIRGGPFERNEWDSLLSFSRIRKHRTWQESSLDGIVELYTLQWRAPEQGAYCVFSPGLGVVYWSYWKDWPGSGGGRSYYLESYEEVETVAKEESFGQVKERVTHPR